MADLFENPIGTDGFEFVEFTSPEPEKLAAYFEQIGFTAVSRHRSKNVLRYKQNDINFILNMEPSGQPAEFRKAHGVAAVDERELEVGRRIADGDSCRAQVEVLGVGEHLVHRLRLRHTPSVLLRRHAGGTRPPKQRSA